MADLKHIERIGDTDANIYGNLDSLQVAIQTDDLETFVWANNGATRFKYAAIQYWKNSAGTITYEDNDFGQITMHDDLLVDEYIKRSGGTDDRIRFENDKLSFDAGGVTALVLEDDKVYTNLDFGVGVTAPSEIVHIQKDQNAGTVCYTKNDTAGTAAYTAYKAESNSCSGSFAVYDDGYTTVTELTNKVLVFADSDSDALMLASANATGEIQFYTGGIAAANQTFVIEDNGHCNCIDASPKLIFRATMATASPNGEIAWDGTNFAFQTLSSGTYYRFDIDTSGNYIFNEDGADVNYRFETDNKANAFYINDDEIYSQIQRFSFGKTTTEAWDSSFAALQIGGVSAVWANTTEGTSKSIYLSNNTYYDGAYKRFVNDETSQYIQQDGAHAWFGDSAGAADTGFTPTKHMQLDVDGHFYLYNLNTTATTSGFDALYWNTSTQEVVVYQAP